MIGNTQCTNSAPNVHFTSPLTGLSYSGLTHLILWANAQAPGSRIATVAFTADGTNSIGESTDAGPSYSKDWQSGLTEGLHRLDVIATDTNGVANSATVYITLTTNGAPVVSGDQFCVLQGDPPALLPVLTNDYDVVGISSVARIPDATGMIAIAPGGTNLIYQPAPNTYGTEVFYYTATNRAGSGAQAAVAIDVLARPIVVLSTPTDGMTTNISSTIMITGNAVDWDGTISKLALYLNATNRLLQTSSASFSYAWSASAAGFYTFTAVATDNEGYTNVSSPVTVELRTTSSGNHLPVALISSPLAPTTNMNGNIIAEAYQVNDGQLALSGSAFDPDSNDPVSWQVLLLDPAEPTNAPLYNVTPGTRDSQGFHSGSINNGSFGTLDLSLVENGPYLLELLVRGGGDVTNATLLINVSSNLKIGQFSFSEQDLVIPVNGIPLTVVRTYNSLNPRSGDFGYAWTYSLNSMDVLLDEERQSVTIGSDQAPFADIDEDDSGLPLFTSVRSGGPLDVTLTLPDGRRATFAFTPEVHLDHAVARWTAPPDVHATLNVWPSDSADIEFFPWLHWKDAENAIGLPSFENHDIPGWVLQTLDGTQYYITRGGPNWVFYDSSGTWANLVPIATYGPPKLTRIVQRSGDTIVIDPDKIYHQNTNGVTRTVVFDRDKQDRITAIWDPNSLSNNPSATYPTVQYVYNDETGNLVQVLKLTDRTAGTYATNLYRYDNAVFPHYITSIIDPLGTVAARNYYDSSGRLVAVVDANNNTTQFIHSLTNNLELVVDRLGRTNSYGYDSRGNVVALTNALGTSVQQLSGFGYDGQNNQIAATNALGIITRSGYDMNGLPLAITNDYGGPLQQLATNSYDANGLSLVSMDVRGFLSASAYDPRGLLLTVSNADGVILTNYYDSGYGWLVGSIDATGVATTNVYDQSTGNLLQIASGFYTNNSWNPVATTKFGHDSNGNQVAITNTLGFVTRYGYDGQNRVIAVTNAFGAPEQTTNATIYDAAGRVGRTINGLGVVTAYGYDALGRRTSVTNALGTPVQQVTTYGFDAEGNQINIVDALGRQTDYVYDALNRQIQTIFPAVASGVARTGMTNVYDGLDRRVWLTNQAAIWTGYGYDGLGRLTSVTNALNKRTQYGYDAAGNQSNQTDALTRATTFAFDPLGRRTKRTLPLSISESFGYDRASRLLAQTNFNGTIITNQYDQLGRLWKRWNSATLLEAYSYSALGQLTNRVDASGTHNWVYDALGRVKTNTTPAGTLKYTYDAAGNLLTLDSTTASGVSLTYQYDSLNRLTNVIDNRLTGTKNTGYGFDGVGNLQRLSYPNGVTNLYRYDPLNRLTNLVWLKAGSARAGFGYTLGAAGNRLTLAETNNGAIRNYTWSYDATYRLTNEQVATTAPTGTLGYGFDDVGNRTLRTGSLGSLGAQSFNYDQRDQIDNDTVPTTASTYFDPNGNTTSYGGTFAYDWANRLISQASPSVTITYDANGNRVKKVAGGVTTWYLVAAVNPGGYPQVVEELTGTTPTTLSKVYSYGLDLVSQRQQPSGTVSFYGSDGLGSVKFLLDTTGAITDTYAYEAYGNMIASSGATPNNYRFTGEQWDPDLGKYYLRARYYDPSTGRFWTRDAYEGTQSDPLSLHKYLYCYGNPINGIDPSGREMNAGSEVGVTGIQGLMARLVLPSLNRASAWAMNKVITAMINPALTMDYLQLWAGYLAAGSLAIEAVASTTRTIIDNVTKNTTPIPSEDTLRGVALENISARRLGSIYLGGNVSTIDMFDSGGSKLAISVKSYDLSTESMFYEQNVIRSVTRDVRELQKLDTVGSFGTTTGGQPFRLTAGAAQFKVLVALVPEDKSFVLRSRNFLTAVRNAAAAVEAGAEETRTVLVLPLPVKNWQGKR